MLRRPFAAALLVVGSLARVAAAQTAATDIARRQLIEQSTAARDRGDHAAALDLATRAGQVRMSASLRLLIAQEHDALGHVVDALADADLCGREAAADATIPNQARIVQDCRALADSLRGRVATLTVRVPQPAPEGLQVRVHDTALVSALWGVSYPVLPGHVVVVAEARDGTFRREVDLTAGQRVEVTVALTPRATPHPVAVTPPRAPITVTPAQGPGAAPWIVVGAGVATLGLGLAFGVLRQDAIQERDARCPDMVCTAAQETDARTYQSSAETYSYLTDVALGVGAVAVVSGVLWYVLARPRHDARPRAALRWSVAPTADGAAAVLSGAL